MNHVAEFPKDLVMAIVDRHLVVKHESKQGMIHRKHMLITWHQPYVICHVGDLDGQVP